MFRALTTLAFVGCVQGDLSQKKRMMRNFVYLIF